LTAITLFQKEYQCTFIFKTHPIREQLLKYAVVLLGHMAHKGDDQKLNILISGKII